jgi:hypothetical protein
VVTGDARCRQPTVGREVRYGQAGFISSAGPAASLTGPSGLALIAPCPAGSFGAARTRHDERACTACGGQLRPRRAMWKRGD